MGVNAVGLISGIIFGICLVLTGLSDPERIFSALRLKDMRIVRMVILFFLVGLISTAIIERYGISGNNAAPAAVITIAIGGLIFGAGFGLTGYTPSTSLASAASGRIDAVFTILGMFFGAYVFIFIYPPVVQPLEKVFSFGKVTLPEITNIPEAIWIVLFLITGPFIMLLTRVRTVPDAAQKTKDKSELVHEGFIGEHDSKRIQSENILIIKKDFLNAANSLRRWKNVWFLILMICLIILQISFWLVRFGYIKYNNEKIPSLPFDITFAHAAAVLNLTNTILVLAAVLYSLTTFFCLSSSFGGCLGGLRFISRAFFPALVALILLLPWQFFFGSTVPGAIYAFSELADDKSLDTGQTFATVLFYLRYVGYWLLVTFLLIRSQFFARSWAKSVLHQNPPQKKE